MDDMLSLLILGGISTIIDALNSMGGTTASANLLTDLQGIIASWVGSREQGG